MDENVICSPTQPTQNKDFSTLSAADIADIICILHPCTPAAFAVTKNTAERSPQHVLQSGKLYDYDDDLTTADISEQQTFILPENGGHGQTMDLALRFSSKTRNPHLQYLFGRNNSLCDFILDTDTIRRVSNIHFRIFVNESGVCMLQDMSTNGTVVDQVWLQGKHSKTPKTRMLRSGTEIQILSHRSDEVIKFIVRIPSRSGYEAEYTQQFRNYMERVGKAEALHNAQLENKAQQNLPRTANQQTTTSGLHASRAPVIKNDWGMHWNGGDKYNVTNVLGKGAFAMVYQVATKAEGVFYAAKELEKRKFMKNGVLDRKLDNEMQIMKDLAHPNIVQFVDYYDHDKHLYIIMEYVPHGDLQQYVSANGSLREATGRSMAAQVFAAMCYLHTKRITHRDIKPDNILLANTDPNNFWVKLSDFGLSKVVKDNDTFLKTFCGTLLYCAPEVFPHYDNHVAAKGGRKRPRKGGAQPRFHSYSQSVDVWSFGAVLWFALCGRTPFEGVMDTTGRGMFERIMKTDLDLAPLQEMGVSHEAMDLLIAMLNTDPAERPTPQECLQHPWLGEFQLAAAFPESDAEAGLNAIDEEEEADENLEPDLSQLRIHEDKSFDAEGEVSLGSSDIDYLDARQSKRFKSHQRDSHNGSSEALRTRHQSMSQGQPKKGMLFGEITASVLNQNPHVSQEGYSVHTDASDTGDENATDYEYESTKASNGSRLKGAASASGQFRPDSFTTGSRLRGNSLSGAESLVRDLNMDSPPSAESPLGDSNGPRTPQTPDVAQHSSLGQGDASEETPTKALEATPRPAFSRQIEIPMPASFYYDPNDLSTHNLEYASLQSGRDFLNESNLDSSSFNPLYQASLLAAGPFPNITQALPSPEEGVRGSNETSNQDAQPVGPPDLIPQALEPPAEFARPPPRLGRLVSTPDSFADITITLTQQITTWGRAPRNDVIYGSDDVRLPKRSLILYFIASNMQEAKRTGSDWSKLPDLHCTIATEAKNGIHVNGVRLPMTDTKGRLLFGRIANGDVVTIVPGRKGKDGGRGTGLTFRVEIFHGPGKEGRKPGDGFKIEIDEKASRRGSDST